MFVKGGEYMNDNKKHKNPETGEKGGQSSQTEKNQNEGQMNKEDTFKPEEIETTTDEAM